VDGAHRLGEPVTSGSYIAAKNTAAKKINFSEGGSMPLQLLHFLAC
jgi:hypothetical protein